MTTAFELASTASNAYLPWTINQAGDPYAVYNSSSRASSRKELSATPKAAAQQDTAELSGASTLLALVETEAGTHAVRIESLRRHIASGTYVVSAYRTAGSLIQSLL